MRQRTKPLVRIVALRAAAQRFSFLLLLMAAVALMMVGKLETALVENVRTRITDAMAPILSALSQPVATVADLVHEANELARLRSENARLRAETHVLHQFQHAAFRLETENLSLRALLNYRPAVAHSYITARVVADNSGAFARSMAINLGAANGVQDGQSVLGGAGLIGRIVQTGERSARILLITDLNARIPVMVETSRDRAILGGDNTDQPQLLYLPRDSHVRIGDQIITSGDGGMFPAGLPVGRVADISDKGIRVQPLEDFSRLEYIRVIDFYTSEHDATFEAAPGFAR